MAARSFATGDDAPGVDRGSVDERTGRGMPASAVMQEAAEWFARLRTLQGQREHGAALQAWLASSPEHRRAWQAVEAVCARFQRAAPDVAADRQLLAGALDTLGRRQRQRRRVVTGLGGIAVVLGAGAAVGGREELLALAQGWRGAERTAVGELREIVLADDTRVWLNTATRVRPGEAAGASALELLAGEIFVTLGRSGNQPLVVSTPQGPLQALSGSFGVRLFDDHARIAVHAGRVSLPEGRTDLARALPGRREFDLRDRDVVAERALAPGRDAWVRGLLLADDISLGEVVAELSRYSRRRLSVSREVAGLRVFGGFPVNQPDRALAMLGRALPIRVRQIWPWWTRIERR